MKLLEGVEEREFWEDWESRFMEKHQRLISPSNRVVRRYSEKIPAHKTEPREEIIRSIWGYVHRNTKYELSQKWKSPSQTITSGIGDCEDMVFLIASILPNYGITNFDVLAGEVRSGKEVTYHSWLEVDGNIVDPTTTPDKLDGLTYIGARTFEIKAEEP